MYKINKYPDGSSYVTTDNRDYEVVKVNSYEDLWHLRQLVDAKNNLGVKPTISIPNLIDAQADRRFGTNQSSGLRLVLEFLKKMKAEFVIFHPHNPEVVESILGSNVQIFSNMSYITWVLRKLRDYGEKDLILMSTDAGGFKPLMKLCDEIAWGGEVVSASKSREYKDKKTRLIQQVGTQDFRGKSVLIIDDICVGGGTFIGLAKILKERNVDKIYLAVSHATMEKLNPELFTEFDKVFVTNSKFDYYFIPDTTSVGGYQPSNLVMYKTFNSTEGDV